MRVYIAGPMRGYYRYNFPKFDRVARDLIKKGYEVINPAQLDRENGFNPLDLPDGHDWTQYPDDPNFCPEQALDRDVEAIKSSDAIFMLEGWENSKNATTEKGIAEWLQRDVWYESSTDATAAAVPEAVPAETAYAADQKPTNPKDEIGARKAKFSTVPANVIMQIGLAMLEGMVKYGRHNYRGCGVRSSIYYDAAMGHLADWWEGQDTDPDSGFHHVDKALASLVVLRDAMMQDKLTDDRPPRSRMFKQDFNADAAAIIDRHSDKDPKHWTIHDV